MITIKNNILFFSLFLLFFSCKKNNDQEIIPDVFVDIEINVNNQEYLDLRRDGGSVNISGGVKGILLYHEKSNNYTAFERNCPYQPSADCAQVDLDGSLLFIQCPCCSSQFDFEGNVISGPSTLPLKEYSSSLNGSYLRIRN